MIYKQKFSWKEIHPSFRIQMRFISFVDIYIAGSYLSK